MAEHAQTPHVSTPATGDAAGPAGPVVAALGRIRRSMRWMLTTERVSWLLAAALGGAFVWALVDFFLRSPGALRLAVLAAGLAALGFWFWRMVWPAVRFAPGLTELALRIERSAAGAEAGLGGVLASGVDLSRQRRAGERLPLAARVIDEAEARSAGLRPGVLVRKDRVIRAVGLLVAVAAIVGAVSAARPDLARIGAVRVLLPLAKADWPKRTGVADATLTSVHPMGAALPLRAVLTKSDQAAARTRVAAEYRVVTEGAPASGPWRRVLLTSQDKAVDLPGVGTGTLFERLIEPAGLGEVSRAGPGERAQELELEYRFVTSDDETRVARVLLVEPPAVSAATLELVEPEYARGEGDGARRIDLGAGTDERAAPPAVLAGSRAKLTIALNKDVPAEAQLRSGGMAWLRETLGAEGAELALQGEGVRLNLEARAWTLEWTLEEPLRLAVRVVDEHGIADSEERAFRIDVLGDNPPSAVVIRPDQDKSVLATAVLEIAGEARDDVGLAWVSLERQTARRPKGSEGAPAEPLGEREAFARIEPGAAAEGAGAARQVVVTETLDLGTMDLKPGDEVWLTALAADAFALGARRHEPVRSLVRKLRIMSRDELIEQIWSELGAVRRGAIQLERDQQELRRASGRPGEQAARQNERAQAGMTERLARQQEAIARLRERLDENAMAEPTLEAVLRQSRETLERAGQSSMQAGESLSEAAEAAAGKDAEAEAGQRERGEAQAAQEEVREELENLIGMLDQGEDTWAAKRSIEQALERERELRDRTADAGRRTTGKSAEQLTPQERQELEQLAEEQQSVAEQTREAIENMLEREEQMRKSDPAAAQAMSQAARRGQREQVPEKMEQAARQVQQNQTNNAQQQQSQAIEALEQMLNDLEQTARNRDEVLRRALASLIESLEALIRQQSDELGALAEAQDLGRYDGLDRGMARLHANTLAVLEEANAGPREIAPVARLIEEAATAQAGAIVALRRAPADSGEAFGEEETSLTKLREAKALAEKLDREAAQREQNRKRNELRKQYAAALARQIELRDAVQDLSGQELTRRVRNSARLIGQDQQALREELARMLEATAELAEAKVFEFAHTRLDELMAAAADRLGAGEPDAGALRRQTSAARVLQSLVDALEQARREDDEFREQEQPPGGGGGGGGPQPLVPPAAELKLLRAMQHEAIDTTRAADEAGAAERDAIAEDAARLQEGIAEQAQSLLDRLSQQGGGGGGGVQPQQPGPGGSEPKP